jgi:hypothetical protein
VARLLEQAQAGAGLDSALSFEVAEGDGVPTPPDAFAAALPPGAVPHLHCSGDWPALLGSLPEGRKTVITLHDCELFTGGCAYPLDCADLEGGCATPCDRNYPDADALRKEKYRLVHRLDAALVSPSRWLARLAKVHLHLPVTIIPNGIPWPEQPPRKEEARQELGINPAARVALFVAHGGEDAAYKFGDEWRVFWKRIRKRVPQTLCFAVGGREHRQEGDFISWPYVERARLARLMAAADVLLYPTRADNHPLVVLEAMAQGLPVVSFSVGGVVEQVAHQETGLLADPFSGEQFSEYAAALLGDPARSRDLGKNAFFLGRKKFTVERMARDYERLYQRNV